jgi:hypothetical protein
MWLNSICLSHTFSWNEATLRENSSKELCSHRYYAVMRLGEYAPSYQFRACNIAGSPDKCLRLCIMDAVVGPTHPDAFSSESSVAASRVYSLGNCIDNLV